MGRQSNDCTSAAGHRSLGDKLPSGTLKVRAARPGWRGPIPHPEKNGGHETPSSHGHQSRLCYPGGGQVWPWALLQAKLATGVAPGMFLLGRGEGLWVAQRQLCVIFSRKVLLFSLAALVVGCFLIASPHMVAGGLQLSDLLLEQTPNNRPSEYEWLLKSRTEGSGRKSAARHKPPQTRDLWGPPPTNGWTPCLDRNLSSHSEVSAAVVPSGYYQVFCDGGLNQLHICICNSVAIAKLMGVTLVLPSLEVSPVWNDPSGFADIFDLPHFLAELEGHVSIVTDLPEELQWSTWEHYFGAWGGCEVRPNCVPNAPKFASAQWYLDNIRPLITKFGVAVAVPSYHRLHYDGLPPEVTQLRCRTAYSALRFALPIRSFASTLVNRLRQRAEISSIPSSIPPSPSPSAAHLGQVEVPRRSKRRQPLSSRHLAEDVGKHDDADVASTGGGYVALHLRFEMDMLAHSACDYGHGLYQKWALKSMRQRIWGGNVPNSAKGPKRSPKELWREGKCPLTPDEIALFLSALGYSNSTTLFVASHSLFGGEERLSLLRHLFPLIETKLTLATPEELQPFMAAANKLAAIDQLICLESDVFLSNAAGNLPNVVTGLRTFHSPPRRSISVHPIHLAAALSDTSLTWEKFSRKMVRLHQIRQGSPSIPVGEQNLYRFPARDCMCKAAPSLRKKSGDATPSRRRSKDATESSGDTTRSRKRSKDATGVSKVVRKPDLL